MRKILITTIFVIVFCLHSVITVDPYLVLQLQHTATQNQVTKQYEKLTKKLKNTKRGQMRKKLYNEAYKQIMLASILNPQSSTQSQTQQTSGKQTPKNRYDRQKIYINQDIPLKPQQQNDTNTTFSSRMNQNNESNYKTAKYIVGIVGTIVKLIPLVLIIWCCKKWKQDQAVGGVGNQNAFMFRRGFRRN